jgi:hypothetical protein
MKYFWLYMMSVTVVSAKLQRAGKLMVSFLMFDRNPLVQPMSIVE